VQREYAVQASARGRQVPIGRLGAADAAAARRLLTASVLRIGGGGGGGGGAAAGLPAVAPLHTDLDFWAGQGEGCACGT
jgi:hypothetical protein